MKANSSRRREIYKIWFGFLKLALKIKKDDVYTDFYASWGDIDGCDFDEWWASHWSIDLPITSKRSIDLARLRAILKLKEFYHLKLDVEEASIAYITWAKQHNAKVVETNSVKVYIPPFLRVFVRAIDEHRFRQEKFKVARVPRTEVYIRCRAAASRLLRRGEVILDNVAIGVFPGSY